MEKTFIPITGRSYRTNSSYGFRLSFQFLTLYANPSCYSVICKTRKTNYFLRERRDLTPPPPSPVHGPAGEGGQKAAGSICSLLPDSSCAVDRHRPKH